MTCCLSKELPWGSRLEVENSLDTRENAAEVLAAIARSRASPLTKVLGSPELLQALVDKAFDTPQGNTLVQARLDLCPSHTLHRIIECSSAYVGHIGVLSGFLKRYSRRIACFEELVVYVERLMHRL
jgi:hypothetical protein